MVHRDKVLKASKVKLKSVYYHVLWFRTYLSLTQACPARYIALVQLAAVILSQKIPSLKGYERRIHQFPKYQALCKKFTANQSQVFQQNNAIIHYVSITVIKTSPSTPANVESLPRTAAPVCCGVALAVGELFVAVVEACKGGTL